MKGKKILLCDRDVSFLSVTKIMLENAGYKVETLSDCKKVLNIIGDVMPELLFMDLRFYDEDCKDLIKTLKSDPVTKEIPIIIFSSESGARETALNAGANIYIKKPFSVEELEEAINKSLN